MNICVDTHELKVWPEYYSALMSNRKRFELRKYDRDFKVGDELLLREYDPKTNSYTGESLRRWIHYIIKDAPQFGLMEGYCILGL